MSLAPGLLAVHAHPDDEVISTGGALADAVSRGLRAMVVTCTDGRRGEVVGEGMDPAEILPRLVEVRREELAAALGILGVTEHAWLGYADSGMMGTEGNDDPEAFWRADMDEAVERLVTIIRRFQPSVVATYDAFGGYGHPDHIQAHRVTLLATEAAAVPALYPEAGPAWRTPKLYLATFARSRIAEANQMFIDRGMASPFGESTDPDEIPMGSPDEVITTTLDVRDHIDVKRDALFAHRSQISPDALFTNIPADEMVAFYGVESYIRHRSDIAAETPEDDLFAGLV